MIRFEVVGDTFYIKDELKKILPKTLSMWSWNKNHWELVIQSNQNRKKFQKELCSFCVKNNLKLLQHEWDGFNKYNNYT